MEARFMIETPDNIQATMKLTMSLKEWGDLRDQLQKQWPSSRLSQAITHVLAAASKVYYAPETDAF